MFLNNTLKKLVLLFISCGLIFNTINASAHLNERHHEYGHGEPLIIQNQQQDPNRLGSPSLLTPLFDNQLADENKDRINVIFFFTEQLQNKNNLLEKIKSGVGADGELFRETYPNSEIKKRDYGLLEVSPYSEYNENFNFWYFDEIVSQNLSQNPNISKELSYIFELDYVLPVFTLSGTVLNRSNALLPIIQYDDNYDIASYYPGNINMYYVPDGNDYFYENITFIHEMMHAVGALYDEYSENGATVARTGYPNCAPNLQSANEWWGDLINSVDQSFYDYRLAVAENYFIEENGFYYIKDGNYVWGNLSNYQGNLTLQTPLTLDDILSPNEFTTQFIQGGCQLQSLAGQYRTSLNNVMNTSPYPILTSVHTNQIEKILRFFSGQDIKNEKPYSYRINMNAYNQADNTFDPNLADISNCDISYEFNLENIVCDLQSTKDFIPQGELSITISEVIDESQPLSPSNLKEYTNLKCVYISSVNSHTCYTTNVGTTIDYNKSYTLTINGAIIGSEYNLGYQNNNPFSPYEFEIYGTPINTKLSIKVLLEGALIDSNGNYEEEMRNNISQYNNQIDNNYVDEVEIEILNENKTLIQSVTGLLSQTGQIIDPNTLLPAINIFNLETSGYIHLNIKHRNHIGVGTKDPIFVVKDLTRIVDLTTEDITINSNMKDIGNGKFALKIGDINNNSIRNAEDRNLINNAESKIFIYSNFDVNMDGIVNAGDRNIVSGAQTAIEFTN